MRAGESAYLANQALLLALPRGGVVINLITPHIDESGTHDDATTIVAGGYIFEANRAAALNTEMGALFDEYRIPYFHASEILPGKPKPGGTGPFDHLSLEDRDVLARAFIASIKEHSTCGFAATIRKSDYARIAAPIPHLPKAYGFMLWQCLIMVGRWCDRTGFAGEAFYYFEDGATDKSDAIRWLDQEVLKKDMMRKHARYYDRAFVRKGHSPAINSADLLVYRWSSHLENKDKPGYVPRKDLMALLRPQDVVTDWADEDLAKLEDAIREWARQLESVG